MAQAMSWRNKIVFWLAPALLAFGLVWTIGESVQIVPRSTSRTTHKLRALILCQGDNWMLWDAPQQGAGDPFERWRTAGTASWTRYLCSGEQVSPQVYKDAADYVVRRLWRLDYKPARVVLLDYSREQDQTVMRPLYTCSVKEQP